MVDQQRCELEINNLRTIIFLSAFSVLFLSCENSHETIANFIETDYLADEDLKRVGKKLRFQFDVIKKLNKKITPKEIIKARKQFRTSVIVRNIYTEVLNIIQPIVINKLKKNKKIKDKKYLNDSLMTSIAGISAAMKNTG